MTYICQLAVQIGVLYSTVNFKIHRLLCISNSNFAETIFDNAQIIYVINDALIEHSFLENNPDYVFLGLLPRFHITAIASQITSLAIVYSTVYSGADQRKHQSPASLACVWRIHRWPVNFPPEWPVTLKMFPFEDVIINCCLFPDLSP